MKIGIIRQPGALWIGAHWSPYCKRWCINIVPCLTVWVMFKGGKVPYSTRTNSAGPSGPTFGDRRMLQQWLG